MNSDELKSNISRGAGIVLAWAAGRYHLSNETIGLIMSDVGYVGAVVAFGYGMFSHWNMKKVPETAVVVPGMKVGGAIGALVVFALLLSGTSLVRAADLPAPVFKAPVSLVQSGTGWYCGVGSTAAVAQANVNGNNLFATSLVGGNLTAAGGSVDAGCGYIRGQHTATPTFGSWWRVEASGSWQNITGSNSAGSVASRWASMQEFDVGADLVNSIFAAVGNLGVNFPSFTPQWPANVAVVNTPPQQYFGAGIREFGLDGSFGAASGVRVGVAPMIKTGYLWQTVGTNGKPNGGALDAFAWVAFPMRGMTFNDVFAAGGAPITTSAGANLGTQYGLGLHYTFRL